MKKNNLYRVLGILFSVVIIAGMFLPYIKEPAYSLFKLYKENNQLVLPIVLLVFGLASLVLYLLNRYIEFALSTGGAVLFYMITETASLIKEDAINQIGIGFIMIAAGGVLLIIVTFLCIFFTKKSYNEPKEEVNNNTYQPNDMIQALENTSNSYTPVEPVQPVEPVMPQPIAEPVVEPVQPVEPVMPQPIAEPVVEPVQPVEPVMPQPIVEPVVEPVQPVEPVMPQPVVEPVVEPVQPVEPVMPQPVAAPVQLEPINELKPIEEPVVVPSTQYNPLPDIQFEPINEPVQEIKPINPEPVEAPLNPVLQQFEIPTSFLNSGAPVKHDEPQSINTSNNTQPSVGMDIFNNH